MGSCLSCGSSSTFNDIRVVHLNGYVENFEQPISVSQVIGNPRRHFLCTSIQLLSSSSKQLNGDTQLRPGHVYFMLPYSILQADVSPVDLACLAKRLTAIAKTSTCDCSNSLKFSPLSGQTVWSSPSRSPSRQTVWSSPYRSLSGQTVWSSPSRSPGRVAEQIGITYGGRSPYRLQPWKPILDTIKEKSFNRRSEADLLENY